MGWLSSSKSKAESDLESTKLDDSIEAESEFGFEPSDAEAEVEAASVDGDDGLQSSPPTYGVADAIALMRTLPEGDVDVIVRVVKATLASARIDVSAVIADATRRQNEIEGRIATLGSEIEALEAEVETRQQEIAALQAEHAETTRVKDRLTQAGAEA